MEVACKKCQTGFEVTEDDLKFYDSVSPRFSGKKHPVPPPTHCPDCRQQRRLALSNERHFYGGKCAKCEKRVMTEYAPHLNQPVYCKDCWMSDSWDPRDYGQDYDFTRPFFEQLRELKRKVPAINLNIQGEVQNSDYIHLAGSCKNCYLLSHADFCEDCSYGYGFKKNTCCVDGFYNLHSELCYDCVDVHESYDLTACQDCINCTSSSFLRDCVGCINCFLCVGLRKGEYYFENQKLTQEEYEKKMAEIDLGSHEQYQKYRKRLEELEAQHEYKALTGLNLQNCLGDHLNNCKDTQYSFDCENVEGGKFCYQVVLGAKNVYDIYQYGTNLEQSYECSITGENSYHVMFSNDCHMSCTDLYYCWYVDRCKDCFGCVNMHDMQYCILNKQYTKEEYEALVSKIIEHMGGAPQKHSVENDKDFVGRGGDAEGSVESKIDSEQTKASTTREWGEFFPLNMALHGYNKSSAQLYYPLAKEQAESQGLFWDEYEPPAPKTDKVIEVSEFPDNITQVPAEITDWAIKCEVTGKLFKITPAELKFYKQKPVPLPRRCPDQRHLDRFARRNPRKFWTKKCDKCEKEIQTTYDPDKGIKTLCEECYMEKAY